MQLCLVCVCAHACTGCTELGQAEALGKPVLCLFRTTAGRSLSAMIRGNTTFMSRDYTTLEDACAVVDAWFASMK
jgi:hypothetical protein